MFTQSYHSDHNPELHASIIELIEEFKRGNDPLCIAARSEHPEKFPYLALSRSEREGTKVYGELHGYNQFSTHREDLAADIAFFETVCRLQCSTDDVQACLFWRLKTGESVADLVEDVFYRNIASLDPNWLDRSGSIIERPGIIVSILAPPAGKKTTLSAHLSELGNNITLDSDAIRFNIVVPKAHPIDEHCYPPNELYLRSQHYYGPQFNKVTRLIIQGLASLFRQHGIDVVVSGFAADEISDVFIWIERDDLRLSDFRACSLPTPEELDALQGSLPSVEKPFAEIGYPDLQRVVDIVRDGVKQRTQHAKRGALGDYHWEAPAYQPVINMQVLGANPEINPGAIPRLITLFGQTMREKGDEVTTISFDEIPIGIKTREGRAFQEKLAERLDALRPQKSTGLIVPGGVNLAPSSLPSIQLLNAAHVRVTYAATQAMQRIPILIEEQIAREVRQKRKDPSTLVVDDVIQQKVIECLTGILSPGTSDPPHRQVLRRMSDSHPHSASLFDLLHLCFAKSFVTETSAPIGQNKWSLDQRFNPEIEQWVPTFCHTFSLLNIAQEFFGDHVPRELYIAIITHEALEEWYFNKQQDGVVFKGKRCGTDPILRERALRDLQRRGGHDGILAAINAEVMTEIKTHDQTEAIFAAAHPVFTHDRKREFLAKLGHPKFDAGQTDRTFLNGPIEYTLLALQKKLFIEKALRHGSHVVGHSGITLAQVAGASYGFAHLDRMCDMFDLTRYFVTPGIPPDAIRAKVIAYASRFLFEYSLLNGINDRFPRELLAQYAPLNRTYLPTLYWAIDHKVNDAIKSTYYDPITDEELFRFYWDYFEPLTTELTNVLYPFADQATDEYIAKLLA